MKHCQDYDEEMMKLRRSIYVDVIKEIAHENIRAFGLKLGICVFLYHGVEYLSIPIQCLRFMYKCKLKCRYTVGGRCVAINLLILFDRPLIDISTNIMTACHELVRLTRKGIVYLSLPISWFARTSEQVSLHISEYGDGVLVAVEKETE
jgi:hypothetical protein